MTTADLAADVLRASAHSPPTSALAAAVSQPVGITLVVTADSADSGCVLWLKSQFPDAVRVVPADTDFTAAALAADAAVLLLPCWSIPDVRMVARWQTLANARPEGTSHVVLDGIEMVKTADDERSVTTLIRRLTAAEPTAFRWTNDETRLRAALARPLTAEQQQRLNVLRLSYAIDLLEDAQPPAADRFQMTPDPFHNLNDRRAKVLRRVRDLRDGLRATVGQAFDDLEGRFERHLTDLAKLLGQPALGPAVHDIVSEWQTWASQIIERRVRAELAIVEGLMPPNPGVHLLPPREVPTRLQLNTVAVLVCDLPEPTKPGGAGPLTPYLRTAGAAVVTPLAAVAFGVPVLGVIGGTAVATAGVLMYDRMTHDKQVQSENRERLRAHLLRKVSAGRDDLNGRADDLVSRLLELCKGEFDREQAETAAVVHQPTPTPFAGWRKSLADLS